MRITREGLTKLLMILITGIALMLILNACCQKPIRTGNIQSVAGLELVPQGASFSFLDSQGKLTTITKIDSVRVVVEQEKPKKERGQAPFIHIGSSGKDKSETAIADNGGVIGKDKSDNKGATDSGNRHKEKTSNGFPWYAWILLILGFGLFLYLKKGLFKF